MITVYLESVTRSESFQELSKYMPDLGGIHIVDSPDQAEVILITDFDAHDIMRSPLLKTYSSKCLTLSDADEPSYYLPGLYASNGVGMLSTGRALTMNYLRVALPTRFRNTWIDQLRLENIPNRYLYSFMGGSTSFTRKRLFKQYTGHCPPDVLIQSTDQYRHWDEDNNQGRIDQQRRYIETMLSSRFVLCPRGAGLGSYRLFETMELGRTPVIISDKWVPIEGVDWSFCLFVKESQLPQLDGIIRSHEDEWQTRGDAARRAHETHFAPRALGMTLERQMRQILATYSPARERWIRGLYPIVEAATRSRRAARAQLRSLVLSAFRITGRKLPYTLNR